MGIRTTSFACAVALAAFGCHGHDHPHDETEHGHDHGESEHGEAEHGESEHGHGHGEAEHDHHGDDHGDDHADDHGDDHHGHGNDGASEVVTLWGETTQLFVEFPALVVGEESAFAAHLTRLSDHFAIDSGRVVVELSGGDTPPERFTVNGPSVAGIFRPVVAPTHAVRRRVVLTLESPAASEVHDMGEFDVFATRAAADGAAGDDAGGGAEISYLLEQQWKVPFRVERVDARPVRANVPAFARLALPSDANATITAPRAGRVAGAGPRFPGVGDDVASGAPLFTIGTAPDGSSDPASLDLEVEQARIAVEAARREVDRVAPLVEQGVVAQRRLDESNSALATARAELRSAQRRRASLGGSQRLDGGGDRIEVPTPVSGVVVELLVGPGAWVAAGDPLARVVDRNRLWLDVGVPEAYIPLIDDVSGAWFTLDNVQGVFELGRDALVFVGAEVDAETRTLPVRFSVENIHGELFAGMTALAHLVTDAPRVVATVPVSAVVDDGGSEVVYVQTGGESFERRQVQLGTRDGELVEVVTGVQPGEWVVARGAWSVRLASMSTESVGHGHAH